MNDLNTTTIDPSLSDDQATIAKLLEQVGHLTGELYAFREHRAQEQDLLSQRNGALHGIEAAKSALGGKKRELSEIEEKIAALLQSSPTPWEETPIGKSLTPPLASWDRVLPKVTPDQVRVLDKNAGAELPSLDLLCQALVVEHEFQGEKRSISRTVEVYGTPWIVTHLWRDEATGAARANVIRLYTKDEWAQLYEADYGRHVDGFDQNGEAKSARQQGGTWCGLVVKVGRLVFVVGPQRDALHLVFDIRDDDGTEG